MMNMLLTSISLFPHCYSFRNKSKHKGHFFVLFCAYALNLKKPCNLVTMKRIKTTKINSNKGKSNNSTHYF